MFGVISPVGRSDFSYKTSGGRAEWLGKSRRRTTAGKNIFTVLFVSKLKLRQITDLSTDTTFYIKTENKVFNDSIVKYLQLYFCVSVIHLFFILILKSTKVPFIYSNI